MKKIIIAIPALNEEKYIKACLTSVLDFIIPKNVVHEIWVWDGGSTDHTVSIVKQLQTRSNLIQLYSNAMKTQAHAMNLTISKAEPDWIMRLDAHSIYPPNYLIDLYQVAQETNAGNVGGVWEIQKQSDGYLDLMAFCLITHPFGVGNSQFRSGDSPGKVDTVPYGFFKYEVFKKIGNFDERLVRAQDYEFNQRMIHNGYTIWLHPKVRIKYFPKNNVIQLLKKYFFLEAPYNAYMWMVAPYTFSLRHSITSLFSIGLIGGGILSIYFPFIFKFYSGVLLIYLCLGLLSSIQLAWKYKRILLILFMPFIFFVFHLGHGLGVIKGLLLYSFKKAPFQKNNQNA